MNAFTNNKQEQIRCGIYFMAYKVIKLNKTNALLFAFVTIAALSLSLLVSGTRILVWETKVNPGDTYELDGWGDLGKAKQAQLICRYFTGRNLQLIIFWYSPNDLLGKHQCPFLYDGINLPN